MRLCTGYGIECFSFRCSHDTNSSRGERGRQRSTEKCEDGLGTVGQKQGEGGGLRWACGGSGGGGGGGARRSTGLGAEGGRGDQATGGREAQKTQIGPSPKSWTDRRDLKMSYLPPKTASKVEHGRGMEGVKGGGLASAEGGGGFQEFRMSCFCRRRKRSNSDTEWPHAVAWKWACGALSSGD